MVEVLIIDEGGDKRGSEGEKRLRLIDMGDLHLYLRVLKSLLSEAKSSPVSEQFIGKVEQIQYYLLFLTRRSVYECEGSFRDFIQSMTSEP